MGNATNKIIFDVRTMICAQFMVWVAQVLPERERSEFCKATGPLIRKWKQRNRYQVRRNKHPERKFTHPFSVYDLASRDDVIEVSTRETAESLCEQLRETGYISYETCDVVPWGRAGVGNCVPYECVCGGREPHAYACKLYNDKKMAEAGF